MRLFNVEIRRVSCYICALVAILVAVLVITGREKKNTIENVYETKETGQYLVIMLDDKEYVPFGAIGGRARGAYLGYITDNPNKKIYEYKGYSSEEWIVSYLKVSFSCSESMLWREVGVTNIPDGLKSEYSWNNISGSE